MAEIVHKISIKAPPASVYEALATADGIARWWTTVTKGDSTPGKTLTMSFGPNDALMRVEALEPGKRVAWEGVTSPQDWIGTKVSFDLTPDGENTTLRFAHRGWNAERSEFMSHCSMQWAIFLLSLRELVETGKGRPFPHYIAA